MPAFLGLGVLLLLNAGVQTKPSLQPERSRGRAPSWILSFLINGEIAPPLPRRFHVPGFADEVHIENYSMKYLPGCTPDRDGPAASQAPSN